MSRKPSRQSGKKSGSIDQAFEAPVLEVDQQGQKLYHFTAKSSVLFEMLSINRRDPDVQKEEGYQRVLPISRVNSISNYIIDQNLIPNSILVSFDNAEIVGRKIVVPPGNDVGWVIDGQHRLAGAYEASKKGVDIELVVVAAIGLNLEEQVKLFITINREAKSVPTSLVLDLLKYVPNRRPSDIANERAADIAKSMWSDQSSPLFNRIVIDSPKANQVSLVNFVRKVTPLVHHERGRLRKYSFEQQLKILTNYFSGISSVFKVEWRAPKSVFFSTLGFGAMMNVFETLFDETLERRNGAFAQSDVEALLSLVSDFDFNQWSSYGSGNKAETEAAKDFRLDFERRLTEQVEQGNVQSIKLD